MNELEYWKRFEKTGNIFDYLNYTNCTACTAWDYTRHAAKEYEEGGLSGRNDCDGNRIICDAHW